MPRPIGTAEELERRRTQAVAALGRGESPTTIARVLGVHVTSVHRWRRMAHSPGGLAAVEHPGPVPLLDASQLHQLERLLSKGASCITLSPVLARPGLYFSLLPVNRTVHAEEVVEFLEELRGKLRGPLTVIWDRHKIHSKAKAVKAYLAKHPEIVAEDLPAYAPEANPDEWVWNWTKYGRLSNLAAQNADELWDWVVESLIDLKFRPDLLTAFLHDAELPLAA
jgi:transposase